MLTGPKIQAKIPYHSGDCVWERIGCTPSVKWRRVKGYSAHYEHDTTHEVSYLIRYDILLQNATDIITKCDSYFVTKCDRSLSQNAIGYLLQNATILLENTAVITKYDVYYKLRQYNDFLQSFCIK